ncbi:uncharacterized protein EV422DRAFT_277129 [Fimicolochytrium jonesii]|uniref:uncharacterized protein n=1 Tax=Fimicolochytrium jonesii TaxID=1396493 RepID=UPI0022FE4FF2|nr:uncharacterized protein EV422DRAFT_277129 [Fimicolochytrium jonesii]KAI8816738.1 hypothetical protein EV422DRAFT_277129 [Fimicolochytrium jonesii]
MSSCSRPSEIHSIFEYKRASCSSLRRACEKIASVGCASGPDGAGLLNRRDDARLNISSTARGGRTFNQDTQRLDSQRQVSSDVPPILCGKQVLYGFKLLEDAVMPTKRLISDEASSTGEQAQDLVKAETTNSIDTATSSVPEEPKHKKSRAAPKGAKGKVKAEASAGTKPKKEGSSDITMDPSGDVTNRLHRSVDDMAWAQAVLTTGKKKKEEATKATKWTKEDEALLVAVMVFNPDKPHKLIAEEYLKVAVEAKTERQIGDKIAKLKGRFQSK